MKPFYRESTYNVPICIVRVFLFVVTLMSFLPKSVSAQSSITYDIEAWNGYCLGCTSSGQGSLVLSGPVPVTANTIKRSSSGSVDFYCGGVPASTVVSKEDADVSAYVFFGLMGMSLNASASVSPQYITSGNYPPCFTYQNPYTAKVYSSAQLGFQDVLHVTFPGIPSGTKVILGFTLVWDIKLTTTDQDNANVYVYLEAWPPGENKPYEKQLSTPMPTKAATLEFDIELQNGASYTWSSSIFAAAAASAGCLDCQVPPTVEWVPKASSGITAMNTTAVYIDVLTPGASYYTDSGTTYPTSDSVHLDISLAGTGSGSVKSSPAGIDCGSTCSVHFLPGTTIELSAIPAADGSIFSGWSGDPGCTEDSVFMTTTKSCTATFDLCPGTTRTKIGSTNYDSISLAYGGAATNGDTIKVLASNQQEGALDFNSGKSVILIGGYDCSFNNTVSYTVVTGSITISTGDVTIGNFVIL